MTEQLLTVNEEARVDILDPIEGLDETEMCALLLELLGQFKDKLSLDSLLTLQAAISKEICKRRTKDPVTLLKEWSEKAHGRKIFYNFFSLGPGSKAGRVTIIEGKKKWSCAAVHQDQPKSDLKKPLKKMLAQMALDKLKEREE